MTTMTYTVTDSVTMTRRNLRRLLRYPSMTVLLVGMPIVFLVLFVYVLGGQLGHGLDTTLAGGHTGRGTSTTSCPASCSWRWPPRSKARRSWSPWT
jgi:hypothetical protein